MTETHTGVQDESHGCVTRKKKKHLGNACALIELALQILCFNRFEGEKDQEEDHTRKNQAVNVASTPSHTDRYDTNHWVFCIFYSKRGSDLSIPADASPVDDAAKAAAVAMMQA